MKLRDMIGSAFANLGRRKVRTGLTSVGVFIGIVTIVTMVSLGVGVQAEISRTVSNLGLETIYVNPTTSNGGVFGSQRPRTNQSDARPQNTLLTPPVIVQIAALSGVVSVTRQFNLPSGIPADGLLLEVQGHRSPFNGTSDAGAGNLNLANLFSGDSGESKSPLVAGRDLGPDEDGLVISVSGLRQLGVISSTLVDNSAAFAALIGQAASLSVTDPRGEQQQFASRIVGVTSVAVPGRGVSAQLGNGLKLRVKQWWFHEPDYLVKYGYDALAVKAASISDATRLSTQIDSLGLRSNTVQALLDALNRISTILQVMASSVGLLALFVASVGIVNTMIMAIYERTREIGVLKALGANRGDILGLFMLEASMIGLLGGLVGVLGGWLLNEVLNAVARDYLRKQAFPLSEGLVGKLSLFQLNPALVIGAVAFAALIGLLAGLYPAFRAASLDPVAALRHD